MYLTSYNILGLHNVYDSVYEICEKLTKSSRIVEFKEIRKVMQDKANKQAIEIPQSDYNNLIRKLSNKFKELRFVHQEHNKDLVFPAALKIEDLVSEYYSLKCELDSLNNSKCGQKNKHRNKIFNVTNVMASKRARPLS